MGGERGRGREGKEKMGGYGQKGQTVCDIERTSLTLAINDTERRAASLRQLSFWYLLIVVAGEYGGGDGESVHAVAVGVSVSIVVVVSIAVIVVVFCCRRNYKNNKQSHGKSCSVHFSSTFST